jgi:hypothetical protein
MKTMAEIQLLRDNKMYQPAYELLAQAIAEDPRTRTCCTTRP